MRKRLYILLLSLCCSSLFTACSSDEKISPEVLRYGEPDTISLGFHYRSVVSDLADTKAPVTVNEAAVNNVNIYVFNELGDVISHVYALNGTTISNIVIYRNMKYHVYAVANAGESMPAKSITELEALVKSITDITQVADASGGVLMSGKTNLQLLTNGQSIQVDLTRCVSKFILKCDYTQLNPDVKITIKRVQLKNAPARLRLFGESKAASGEVIDGEERTGADLVPLSGSGATFYLFENMQGQVASSALSYKQKEGEMSAQAKANSSYIEMVYDYLSASKSGTIIYRFYMGNTYADCNIKRNTQYTCTVLFKGDGSADENSWSVDNSALIDLVTGITLNPTSHKFTVLGGVFPIVATVFPATANNKALAWSSSNTAVATVDDLGNVTSVGDGTCTITATSTDGTNISATCAIEVESKIFVTGVTVSPETLSLFPAETGQLTATVLPADAAVKAVSWSSSNTDVATVDASGKVTAVAAGTADITVMSTDDNSKKAVCKVTVKNKEFTIDPLTKTLYIGETFAITYTVKPPVLPTFVSGNSGVATVDANGNVKAVAAGTAKITVSANGLSAECVVTVVRPEITFPYTRKVMYDGEVITIPYAKLVPSTTAPTVSSSNTSVAEIVEATTTGVKIKAKAVGSSTITATIAGVSATVALDVQLLRIEFNEAAPLNVYVNFNKMIDYTVYPEHARGLEVKFSYGNVADDKCFIFPDSGIPNKIQGAKINSSPMNIVAGFIDYPTKTFTTSCIVKPQITMKSEMKVVVNMGNETVVESLDIDTAPQAKVQFTWVSKNPGSYAVPDAATNKITFPFPNGANGAFTLRATVVGDNGNGDKAECTVGIYETIYLVGVSKTTDREGNGSNKFTYVNEVIAKWLSHPNSILFPTEEVYNDFLPYIYDGVTYHTDHTGVYERISFTFNLNESYSYALDLGSFTYNGSNVPDQYMEFFNLSPVGDRYQMANDKYLYIYSRPFASGLVEEKVTWREVFKYIYPD